MKMKRTALIALAMMLAATPALAKTRIFFSMNRDDDKFVNILHDSIMAAAAKDPDVDVTVVYAGNDSGKQVEQVQAGLANHPDVVIALPVDEASSTAIANAAAASKTPLVYINRRPSLDHFGSPTAIVSSNDLVAGRLQMRLIADKLGNSGNVVILRGENGHPAAIERTEGIKEILATRPGIKLIAEETGNWQRAQAEKLVDGWLDSGQPINAILANNDEMAMGAIASLQKHHIPPGKIAVAGVDGTADAMNAIKTGYMTLSLLQNANAQGEQALADAKKFSEKEYAQLYDWVPYELIIPSNVKDYAGQ